MQASTVGYRNTGLTGRLFEMDSLTPNTRVMGGRGGDVTWKVAEITLRARNTAEPREVGR